MAKIGAVILLLAGVLGARGAAREIAAPFEGLDRLALARRAPAPEPLDTARFDYEIPSIPSDEPEPESETMATHVNDSPAKSEWDQWKEQAIASLPEELRENSVYSQAIEVFYLRDVGVIEESESLINGGLDPDAADAWIINRPPVGGWDFGGVGFTDIDEHAEPEKPDEWTAFWDDWKARAIAALPEAERNDPNRLKEIDTTLVLAARSMGGISFQESQWMEVALEVTTSQQKAQKAK